MWKKKKNTKEKKKNGRSLDRRKENERRGERREWLIAWLVLRHVNPCGVIWYRKPPVTAGLIIIIIIIINPSPVLENDTHKLLWDFDIHTDHLISARRPDLIIIKKKKKKKKKRKTCKIVDLAVPADHWIKLKECEKKDKYFDLARELKKLRNIQVTIIPIVISAFGTVTKGLLKGLEDLEVGGRVETIQTTALLRTARILRRVLETWGNLLSLRLQWKTIG